MHEFIKDSLTALTLSYGPSGRERKTADVIMRYLKRYTDLISVDTSGNVTAKILPHTDKARRILLDAHYDEIAMIVTDIDDGGFVHFDSAAGVDRRTLLSAEVIIHGLDEVFGIVSVPPVHILSKEEKEKLPDFEDLVIDTGFSYDKVKRLVNVGDMITHKASTNKLLNTLYTGKSMDNRAGVCVLLTTLEMLKDSRIPYELNLLFCTEEEFNLSGSKTGAYNIDPDLAVAVDVTFAKSAVCREDTAGEMGKGPMVGFAPILNRKMSLSLCEIAEKAGIPYQKEIMNSNTGTDCAAIFASRLGVPTGLISVPLRYMHSQTEVVDIEDINSSARLLYEFLKA